MKQIILIKIGGSVITDKKTAYSADLTAIKKIAKALKKLDCKFIVGHGSGSFGHTSAEKYGGKKGYKSKWGIAKVCRDAMEINRIFMDIFIEEKLPVISLRPMSFMLTKDGKLAENFFQVIETVLNQGLIPVIYGDVIWDKRWKSCIYSGESTLNEIAIYLLKKGYEINKIVQLGNTNGVYNGKKKTIPLINSNNWCKIKKYVHKLKDPDVTGGMDHKVDIALKMADSGIKTWLINGKNVEDIKNAINEKSIRGTKII